MEIRVLEGLPLPEYLSEETVFTKQLAGLAGLGGVLDTTENLRAEDVLFVARKFLGDMKNALTLGAKILKKRNKHADTRGLEILANSCTSYTNLRNTLQRFENGNLSGLNTDNMLLSGVEQIIEGLGFIKKLAKKVASGVKKAATAVKKVATKAATAVKTTATKVGTAVKKAAVATGTAIKKAAVATGKGIAKAAKVVGKGIATAAKAVAKFNPLTLAIQFGIRKGFEFNLLKVAQKCYGGVITPEQNKALGFTEKQYQDSKKAFSTAKKIYNGVAFGQTGAKELRWFDDAVKKGFVSYLKKQKANIPAGLGAEPVTTAAVTGAGATVFTSIVAAIAKFATPALNLLKKVVDVKKKVSDTTSMVKNLIPGGGNQAESQESNHDETIVPEGYNYAETAEPMVVQARSVVSNLIPSEENEYQPEESQTQAPQQPVQQPQSFFSRLATTAKTAATNTTNLTNQPTTMSTQSTPSIWDKITGTVSKVANVANTVSNATTQITDTVKQPVTATPTYVPQQQPTAPQPTKSANKMMLFAGIGAAVVVGGILLMRKKK